MGEVEEFGGGVDEREAEGDEGVYRTRDYGVYKKLIKHLCLNCTDLSLYHARILKDSLSICKVNLTRPIIPFVVWTL